MLDTIEDWIGRARPLILGSDGVSAANDRGQKLLADIQTDKSTEFDTADGDEDKQTGWVEGVGEGRTNEANLSFYLRMSEGDDDTAAWKTGGLRDLTQYQNVAVLQGPLEPFGLEPSTSSVDEGENGKVKSLYDLVFSESGVGVASGLVVPATRGSSLDIGVLHGLSSQRKTCSIEYWYFVPHELAIDIILVRRTMGETGPDEACLASNQECVLWELSLLKSGLLEFRTCGGSTFVVPNVEEKADDSDDEECKTRPIFGRWNHFCLVLSSKETEPSECSVSVFTKGNVSVADRVVSLVPSSMTDEDLRSGFTRDDLMKASLLVFGLDHCEGFRMTELRVWACKRSSEDTASFMYEYLTAAEQKKKFKVKIASKNKKGLTLGKGLGLAPPNGQRNDARIGKTNGSELLQATSNRRFSLAPMGDGFGPVSPAPSQTHVPQPRGSLEAQTTVPGAAEELAAFDVNSVGHGAVSQEIDSKQVLAPHSGETSEEIPGSDVAGTLWDAAIPLSQQIRPSAAAALMRGPPATRHFGGNRGGLADFIGMDRFGVGGIAICGPERTVVWRDNEDPPALTYPVGASGALVSDTMNDEGSEFLCCFIAKEKRIILYELNTRSVVVELSLSTKLNFWRFLPPEAAGNTLCFMLVTPVGGFHWMPLEASPRPRQIWKRGPELQGKKIIAYEEGGSNGLEDANAQSMVGMILVSRPELASTEAWLVLVSGQSHPRQVSDSLLGACLCQPPNVDGPFLPYMVLVDENAVVTVSSMAIKNDSLLLQETITSYIVDMEDVETIAPPSLLTMGPLPNVLVTSLANIIVVLFRSKGIVVAFELDGDLNLIAQQTIGHYIVDAVMRYSPDVGAEIVMLLADKDNSKDGRVASFCFRSTA